MKDMALFEMIIQIPGLIAERLIIGLVAINLNNWSGQLVTQRNLMTHWSST